MRRVLLPLIAVATLAAACGGDAEFAAQSATEAGAVEAATQLQEAALRGDADGIRRGLSDDCLDSIDDDEFRAAVAFLRLFTEGFATTDISVEAEVVEFEADRAVLAISYVDDDGRPIDEGNGEGFTLSSEDMTLVRDGGRWVTDECDFSGSGSSGPGRCLDQTGSLGDCAEPTVAGRDAPVALGRAAHVGEGWMVRISSVDFDAADTIEAESGFSPDLEPGFRAVLIDLELAYVGDDEPQNPFSLSMGGVGAGNVSIETFGCGFLPHPIEASAGVFTGGLLAGQQCLPTPENEVDSVLLYVETFGGERVFFDLRGEAVDDEMPTARGPVPGSTHEAARLAPIPIGQSATAGDWTVRVVDVDLDGTAAVMATDEFNREPDPGTRYVLVGFEATFDGNDAESANAVQPDLLTAANISVSGGCSVNIDDEFDAFAEVFTGGTLSGTICYVVDDEDMEGLTAFVQPDFFADEITVLALT